MKQNFPTYEETLQTLKSTITPWERVEKVAITEALDRHIAFDVIAADNYPAHATSAMDGYAFAWSEGLSELTPLADLPAGSDKGIIVGHGECVKTFTGSLMSEGTDTLVPVENVEVAGDKIIIKIPVKKGFAVREVGESYKKGEILIKRGTRLNYGEIALLAELGLFHISVFVRPKVAILATGSEIKDLGEPLLNAAQIHSSNHIGIAAMVRKMGAEPMLCEIVRDEADAVKTAMLNALKTADILVTTGGVSMGDYDFVKGALGENLTLIITGAAIKPGRHIKVAKAGERYVFALPGFPYTAMVTCALYVWVLVEAWLGREQHRITAIMDEDYKKRSPFLEFTAVNLTSREGKNFVNLNGKRLGSSAIVNNLLNDAALLIIPQGKDLLAKGEVVEVLKMV